MVSFSKLPGMVAFCIVVLTRTLGSAAPVPQTDDHDGVAAITDPVLMGVVDPALTGVASGVVDTIDGSLGTPVGELVHNVGDAISNVAPAVEDTMYVQH
jgi:hypothetical protein